MPVYSVVHQSKLTPDAKESLASQFTDLHHTVTGARRDAVRVAFFYLDSDSFFHGGQRVDHYARVTAQIRVGRSEEQKRGLLRGMYDIMQEAFDALDASEAAEIQTQIIEVDDRLTVMTNGVLNT